MEATSLGDFKFRAFSKHHALKKKIGLQFLKSKTHFKIFIIFICAVSSGIKVQCPQAKIRGERIGVYLEDSPFFLSQVDLDSSAFLLKSGVGEKG